MGQEVRAQVRRREPRRGNTWHLDEMAVKFDSETRWLWRAVDQDGFVLDILLQEHRDTDAAKTFFEGLLDGLEYVPKRVVTDKLRSYVAALRELPAFYGVEHVLVRAAARQNNLIEQSHRPTRDQERQQRCFRSPPTLSAFCPSMPASRTSSASLVTAYQLTHTAATYKTLFKLGLRLRACPAELKADVPTREQAGSKGFARP